MSKRKWYVVWNGVNPGIYDTWNECKNQIEGFENAVYKSFETLEEARNAYNSNPREYIGKGKRQSAASSMANSGEIILDSLSVDAACSGNPGDMEYRGVHTRTKQEIFRVGPFTLGTNNVGEFLALVHGLALLKKQNLTIPVYSDSANAISWVKQKKCKTKLIPNEYNKPIFDLIARAEIWLQNNTYSTPILKWETKAWGEIPADFGRK
ncbi:ribonuclease HI [Dysgonomonadaceae bacterium PH5-43]|nr:ribonuclease HI [Dysgonomonadaceae bacterium PH5-43]